MKGVVVTILILVLAAGGLWYFVDQRNQEIRARNAEIRAAAEKAERDARIALYGEEGLNPAIEWRDTGMGVLHVTEGDGASPVPGGEVTFNYVVRLADGTEVQRLDKPTEARIGQMIPGVSAGLQSMRTGGRAVLFIPPALGYGGSAYGSIPPDSGLIFEVELLRP